MRSGKGNGDVGPWDRDKECGILWEEEGMCDPGKDRGEPWEKGYGGREDVGRDPPKQSSAYIYVEN